MNETIRSINERAARCPCGHHTLIEMHCEIGKGVIQALPAYVASQGYANVLVVVDRNTWAAAGERVSQSLWKQGLHHEVCALSPNEAHDVVADERAIVEIMLRVKGETDAIIAVGSGTIHDAVRFACAKLGKAFLSVSTAASVDGYTSAGAPLIVRGKKQTVQAVSPEAMFADTDVLVQAPMQLTAAGFGDMLGKYTSLADWVWSRDLGNEPFCPLAYELTEQALASCEAVAADIAERGEDGIRILFEALTVSGFAMLLAGHSRSASGAEHHLSHYWEMEFLRAGKRQLLHGAKVGVAAVIVAALYRRIAAERPELASNRYSRLPGPEAITQSLRTLRAPTTARELGVDVSLAEQSLMQAHRLRDRYTGLRWVNEEGMQHLLHNLVEDR
ncbi:sn-glycerol-1-phosphate dehydrogenase [Paenibacillus sp. TRM 82003]|nr:sn-glycerol-1-phosphate dehydrogenase [Paenibacillus sp. TRM 82003]